MPASLIWMLPADQVVVPFSRSVWPAAKRSMVAVIVVCEPAVKRGRARVGEIARAERGLAGSDGQRAVAAARAVAREAQRAGAAVVVEIEDRRR